MKDNPPRSGPLREVRVGALCIECSLLVWPAQGDILALLPISTHQSNINDRFRLRHRFAKIVFGPGAYVRVWFCFGRHALTPLPVPLSRSFSSNCPLPRATLRWVSERCLETHVQGGRIELGGQERAGCCGAGTGTGSSGDPTRQLAMPPTVFSMPFKRHFLLTPLFGALEFVHPVERMAGFFITLRWHALLELGFCRIGSYADAAGPRRTNDVEAGRGV